MEWILTGVMGVFWLLEKVWWEKRREVRGRENVFLNIFATLFPWLLIFAISKTWIMEPFRIPSRSMAPGLEAGDFILADKWAYGLSTPWGRFFPAPPKVGDVVIFTCPDGKGELCVKRVMGLSGDVVIVGKRGIFINGKAVEGVEDGNCMKSGSRGCVSTRLETWEGRSWTVAESESERKGFAPMFEGYAEACDEIKKETVCRIPEGTFFALGDNRGDSEDSRYFGFVEMKSLVGRGRAVFFSQNNFGRLGGL